MPYISCPSCRVPAYVAAGYAYPPSCPNCEAPVRIRRAQRPAGLAPVTPMRVPELRVVEAPPEIRAA